jgi:bacillithiol biosynthesis cysteine-adding enzyme BshC
MTTLRVERVSYATAGFGDMLTHDLAYGVPSALAFLGAPPWEEVAAQLQRYAYQRAQLCAVLEQGAVRHGAPRAALDNIARLRDAGTYVVATGQQAGFLGGPLYTLHKALTAIKLARQLEAAAAGRARFVPVFWVAGDDHDLAEIDHAELLTDAGDIETVTLPLTPASAGRSACDAYLEAGEADALTQRLARVLAADAAAGYVKAYCARNLDAAFARLLNGWLGELGLVVVSSADVRRLAAPILLRESHDYDVTGRLVREAGLRMQQAGYKPGFPGTARNGPHFFVASEPDAVRARVEVAGAGFTAHGKLVAVPGLLQTRPELFSADAALRPVVQQHIFPVAAAVLGPGEIAYWAQLKGVFAHFGVTWPRIVPRATLTLLDARAEKALRKLGLAATAPELFAGAEALRKMALSGARLQGAMGERVARILADVDALKAEVETADAGLRPLTEKARARIEHELQRMVQKTEAAMVPREEALEKRLRYLAALVRPRNQPQERVLATGPFLAARPGLPAELLETIDPEAREHLVVTMG